MSFGYIGMPATRALRTIGRVIVRQRRRTCSILVFYDYYLTAYLLSTAGRMPELPAAVARAPVLACLHAGLFRVGNILSPGLFKDRLSAVPLRTNQWC
jgi:hypothetical protein